jgi:hypothetical protein
MNTRKEPAMVTIPETAVTVSRRSQKSPGDLSMNGEPSSLIDQRAKSAAIGAGWCVDFC